jgi:hypothetical protein
MGMNVAEWVTAGSELLIAAVIFLELEEGRRDKFLAEAANMENYIDRGKIYAAFYDTDGDSIGDRSKRFCERIWKREKEDIELKKSCERQIVLFNRLGQIRRHAWLFKDDYVKLFPHAVVLFWIMVEPYIEERRAMTGGWWGRDFEQLTRKCLRFLLKDTDARLYLYDEDRSRKKDLEIPTNELRRLEKKLRSPNLNSGSS